MAANGRSLKALGIGDVLIELPNGSGKLRLCSRMLSMHLTWLSPSLLSVFLTKQSVLLLSMMGCALFAGAPSKGQARIRSIAAIDYNTTIDGLAGVRLHHSPVFTHLKAFSRTKTVAK